MAKNNIDDTFTHKFVEKFNDNEKFIEENLLYEIIAGSFAYGVNNILSQSGRTFNLFKGKIKFTYNEKINIIGHTDDIPPSPNSRFKDNWEISAMRALNVLRFLASLGINPERMMATGLADTKPLVPNTSPKNRKRNRRVEIILEREV